MMIFAVGQNVVYFPGCDMFSQGGNEVEKNVRILPANQCKVLKGVKRRSLRRPEQKCNG